VIWETQLELSGLDLTSSNNEVHREVHSLYEFFWSEIHVHIYTNSLFTKHFPAKYKKKKEKYALLVSYKISSVRWIEKIYEGYDRVTGIYWILISGCKNKLKLRKSAAC